MSPSRKTLRALAQAPEDRPILVLLRHAAREKIPEGETGAELPITRSGVLASEEFGRLLGARLRGLSTSPLLRCVQTAEAVLRGSGRDLAIAPSRSLGDPGAFVEDPEAAWRNWLRLGHRGVLTELARGGAGLPGMLDVADGASRLIDFMRTRAANLVGVHLFITHDSLVLPVMAHRRGAPVPPEDWPGFLEGVWLDGSGNGRE